jgi:hypothetical protein
MAGGFEWHLTHRLWITSSTSHGNCLSDAVVELEHALAELDARRASKVKPIPFTYSSVRNTRPVGGVWVGAAVVGFAAAEIGGVAVAT